MLLRKALFCITATACLGLISSKRIIPAVMYFPDENGNMKPSILSTAIGDVPPINEEKDVTFFLYTRLVMNQIFVGNLTSIKNSSFDETRPTIFVTHGYRSSAESSTVQVIKDTYLRVMDCNVIAIDWSGLANNILYNVVKEQTLQIGAYVAKLIDFMANYAGMGLENVHMSGHSLGAHIIGIAGKNVQSGSIGRITGIDPAGPLYTVENTTNRLAVGDAKFVDVIHACGGLLSFEEAIGDTDFFPNGGHAPQPGCGSDIFGSCSHDRSWRYFAESIDSNGFMSLLCDNYDNFKEGKCNDSPKVPMGEPVPFDTRGTYYLDTASSPPYALG